MTSDAVYRLLEKKIILGHLKPRERLPESALCRRLKASRTLLREVFRRLEGAGLVTLQPNRGVAVRDFSPSEVGDVYQTHQIRYIAWLSPARVQRSIREHKTILMALVRRDGAALWRVVRAHLAAEREDYRRILPVGDCLDHAPDFHRPGAG